MIGSPDRSSQAVSLGGVLMTRRVLLQLLIGLGLCGNLGCGKGEAAKGPSPLSRLPPPPGKGPGGFRPPKQAQPAKTP